MDQNPNNLTTEQIKAITALVPAVQKKHGENEADTSKALIETLKRYNRSWQYAQKHYHKTWDECFKLYNNIRVKKSKATKYNTFVPMSFSLVETLVAGLYNGRPRVNFVPNQVDQETDTKILSEKLDDDWSKGDWDNKVMTNGRNKFITGNGSVMLFWDGDRVDMEIVPIRDFIMDPSSHSSKDWKWAGRRYLVDKADLESATIIDVETGEEKARYTNLDALSSSDSGSGGGAEQTDKQRKEALIGSTSTENDGGRPIEIIEIWDYDRVVTVANRTIVIEDIDNPMKVQAELRGFTDVEGIIPFAIDRDYVDSSLPYAKGEIEVIKDEQNLLNDLNEMYVEAILYTLYPTGTLDPKYADWLPKMEMNYGKIYPFAQNALNWNTPPIIPGNVFNYMANIKSEIRETTSIDQIVKGVTSATEQTATEIKAQLGQANQRIEVKAKQLENDFYQQVANIWFQLTRLYAEPQLVRVASAEGVDFKEFDPSVFMGDYSPVIELDITHEMNQGKQQQEMMQAWELIIADPTNNLEEAKKIIYPKILPGLSKDDIERIITPPQPEEPSMPGAPGAPGSPPADIPPTEQPEPQGVMSPDAMAAINGGAA